MPKVTLSATAAILLAALFVFYIYHPAIFFDFVWDDVTYFKITSNHLNPNYLEEALTKPFLVSHNYYRPFVTLWLYIEADLTGTSTVAMHLTNILLHCINVILLGTLITQLFKEAKKEVNTLTVLICCLFFGLHPTTIEVAAWISGRFDLLLTTFLLLALILDLKVKQKFTRAFSVGACFLFAALCKEMALGFALALPFWHLLIHSPIVRPVHIKSFLNSKQLAVYLAVFISGLLYLGIRKIALGYVYLPSIKEENFSILDNILLSTKSLGIYLQMLTFPFTNLSPIHAEQLPIKANDMLALATALGLSVIFSLSYFFKIFRYIALLLLIFTLSLFPVLHFFGMTIGENIAQGRFVVFPLVWMTASLTFLYIKYSSTLSPKLLLTTKCVILFLLSINTLNTKITLPLWTNNLSLWQWAVTVRPESSEANASYAASLSNNKNYDKALIHIEKAISKKQIAKYFTIKGTILGNMGKNSEAEKTLKHSLNYIMHPKDYALTLQKIASAQLQQNKKDDVLKLLGMAKKITPYSHSLYLRYFQYYDKEGNYELALSSLQKAVELSYGEQKEYYSSLLKVQSQKN